MKTKTFPLYRKNGKINYWDCVALRLRDRHRDDDSDLVWRERAKDIAWKMHKDLLVRINFPASF